MRIVCGCPVVSVRYNDKVHIRHSLQAQILPDNISHCALCQQLNNLARIGGVDRNINLETIKRYQPSILLLALAIFKFLEILRTHITEDKKFGVARCQKTRRMNVTKMGEEILETK